MSDDDYDDDIESLKLEVQRLRKENRDLKRQLEGGKTPKAESAKKSKAVSPAASGVETATSIKKHALSLFSHVKRAVKKQGHTREKKPWCEEVSAVWSQQVWDALLGECPTASESKQMIKKIVPPSFAVSHLHWDPLIHGCKFTGKQWVMRGMAMPKLSVSAGYDTIEFRYKPATQLVTCKVRTYLAATYPGKANEEELNAAAIGIYE